MKNVAMDRETTTKKYFFCVAGKTFVYFILLSLIILLFTFFFYRIHITNEAMKFHIERIRTITNQVETQYIKMNQLAAQLTYNEKILQWIYNPKGSSDFYLLREIQKSNTSIVNANNGLISLDVYNSGEDSVLSTYSGYWCREDLGQYKFGRDFIFSEFMENQYQLQILYNPDSIYNMNLPHITFLYSLPLGTKLGALAFVFETEKLFKEKIYKDENIIVLDNLGNIHYEAITDEDIKMDISDHIYEYLEGYPNYDQVYTRNINSSKYYIVTSKALNNNFKIMLLGREAKIIGDNIGYLPYFKVFIIFLIFISLSFSFFIYREAHRPIEVMASKIKNRYPQDILDFAAGDELIFLNRIFDNIMSRSDEAQILLADNRDFLIENTMRNIIFGRGNEGLYSFEELGFLTLPISNFIVLIFNMDQVVQEDSEETAHFALSHIQIGIRNTYDGYYLRTGIRNYTMVLNLGYGQTKEKLIKLIEELQEYIRSEYGVTISVSMSQIKHSIGDITQAYDEALEALKYKVILGDNQLIDSTFAKQDERESYFFSIKESEALIKALRIGSENQINQLLHEIIHKNTHSYSIELLNVFFLYISSCIAQVATEYNIMPEHIFDRNIFDILINYESIEDKEHFLREQCRKIVEARSSEDRRYKKISIDIVIKYIEEHYNQPITLKEMADEFGISVSYLSSLLKRELGVNYSTYLTNLRMEKAKRILDNSDYTIKQIASMVGYDNEQSFLRNFKQSFSQTPSEYRNREI